MTDLRQKRLHYINIVCFIFDDHMQIARRVIMNSPPVKLLDQVRALIRMKHYSIRTEEAYVSWIKRFILFHEKRHPKDLSHEDIERTVTISGQSRSF